MIKPEFLSAGDHILIKSCSQELKISQDWIMQILLLIKLFFFFTWNDLRRSERMWIASITQSGSNTYSGSSGFEALIHGCPVFQSGMANPFEHSY
jgi:hypothetical protein